MIEILYILIFVLISASIGKKILNLFKFKLGTLEEFVFCVGIGYAVLSYLTLILGLLGLLYKGMFYMLFLILIIVSLKEIKYFLLSVKKIRVFRVALNFESFLFVVLILLIVLNFLITPTIPFGLDVLAHYLAVPKIYILHHAISDIPYLNNSDFPMLIHMLFLVGMLIKSYWLAKLVAYSVGILLTLAIYSFCKRYFNKKIALLASVIFYSLPTIIQGAQVPRADIALAFYSFLAVYAFINYSCLLKKGWLVLSAIFIGLSASAKLNGIFNVFIFSLFIFVMVKHKQGMRKAIFLVGSFVLISIIIVSPWYIKSYTYTGNPIYPYAYDYFGGEYYSKELAEEGTEVFEDYGTGKGLLSYILLPWNMTMQELKFGSLLGIGPIFLLFIPPLFLFKRDREYGLIVDLLLISWLFITMWFLLVSHALRHILVVLALLSVIAAYTIHRILKHKYLKTLTIFILIFMFLFNFALWKGARGDELAPALGLETTEEFTSKLKTHSNYEASQYINKNLPNSKILLFREYRGYYLDVEYVNGFPTWHTYINYMGFEDEEDLYKRLKEIGITHIMINEWEHYRRDYIDICKKANELMERLLAKSAVKIYDERGIVVYVLK